MLILLMDEKRNYGSSTFGGKYPRFRVHPVGNGRAEIIL
jgi:hypothetical protein